MTNNKKLKIEYNKALWDTDALFNNQDTQK